MFKRTLENYTVAYAVVLALAFSSSTFGQGVQKTAICHATGSGHFNYLELPPEPLDDHIDSKGSFLSGHEDDFFPKDNDCDKSNDGSTDPGGNPDPGAVPEPITVLLFGAGVAGIGYASRKIRRKRESNNGGE